VYYIWEWAGLLEPVDAGWTEQGRTDVGWYQSENQGKVYELWEVLGIDRFSEQEENKERLVFILFIETVLQLFEDLDPRSVRVLRQHEFRVFEARVV